MKNVFVALVISVFLIACGEQNIERQKSGIELDETESNVEVVEADDSLVEEFATISGDITFDTQLELPENARLVVYLVDTSARENGVTTLLSESYKLVGPPPYSYELKYEKSLVSEKGSYALKAVVRLGKDALFRGAKGLSLFPDADVTL
ncbi:MAG: YbaY family lipoprotein, partial [Nitrospira sp.]|nr:YbaY family lipoprotein [Nitrospira sp.]